MALGVVLESGAVWWCNAEFWHGLAGLEGVLWGVEAGEMDDVEEGRFEVFDVERGESLVPVSAPPPYAQPPIRSGRSP